MIHDFPALLGSAAFGLWVLEYLSTYFEGADSFRVMVAVWLAYCGIILVGMVVQAALMHATISASTGRRISAGAAFVLGARNLGSLVLLAIASSLGVLAGLALLVVPGLFLATIWSVALPVVVTENLGAIESLRRSAALTKGVRWPLFWLTTAYFVVSTAVAFAFDPEFGGWGGGVSNLIEAVIYVIFSLTTACFLNSAYIELRAREGVRPDQIATVFD